MFKCAVPLMGEFCGVALTVRSSVVSGEQENIDKFSKRLVKVTKQHNDECKQLLTLMGVPYIEVNPNESSSLFPFMEDTGAILFFSLFFVCVNLVLCLQLYI